MIGRKALEDERTSEGATKNLVKNARKYISGHKPNIYFGINLLQLT